MAIDKVFPEALPPPRSRTYPTILKFKESRGGSFFNQTEDSPVPDFCLAEPFRAGPSLIGHKKTRNPGSLGIKVAIASVLFAWRDKLRRTTASACRFTWNVRTWPANVRTRPTNFDFYPESSFKCRTCASRRVTLYVNVFSFARSHYPSTEK